MKDWLKQQMWEHNNRYTLKGFSPEEIPKFKSEQYSEDEFRGSLFRNGEICDAEYKINLSDAILLLNFMDEEIEIKGIFWVFAGVFLFV